VLSGLSPEVRARDKPTVSPSGRSFCDQYARDRGSAETVPSSSRRARFPAESYSLPIPSFPLQPLRPHNAHTRARADATQLGITVQPRLAVGDVSARQALILLVMKNQMLEPNRSDRQTASAPWGKRAAGGSLTTVGLRPPSVSLPPSPLTLIVARHASSLPCDHGSSTPIAPP